MSKPDGGPAFPYDEPVRGKYGPYIIRHPGMSLRDWFMGQADVAAYEPMTTFEANRGRRATIAELAAYIAEIRAVEADAMLAVRAKE